MTEQLALRFPGGTRDRIRALARPGETMTNVVLRALDCLTTNGDDVATDHQGNGLQIQIDALAARVSALEGKPSTTHQRPIDDSPERLAVLERVRQLRETGASFQRIADTLNREGTPTLSGRGQWRGGTVGKLLDATPCPLEDEA